MSLPKSLQPDSDFACEIRNDDGELAVSIYGELNNPDTREFRDEIVTRWNSYETLRDTLATLQKLFAEENTRRLERQSELFNT